jgi:hypothetical protein
MCEAHFAKCEVCGASGCPDCIIECGVCGRKVCLEHVAQCAVCRKPLCSEHAVKCAACERTTCAEHKQTCGACGRDFCPEHYVEKYSRCRECYDRALGAKPASPPEGAPTVRRKVQAEPAAPPEPTAALEPGGQDPSMLILRCPSCSAKLMLPREHMGKRVKCPRCNAVSRAGAGPSSPV